MVCGHFVVGDAGAACPQIGGGNAFAAFECPQALVDAFGGWLDRKMIDAYLKYAEVCFTHFKGRVKRWVTVNEQLIATAAGIMNGNFEQDKQKNLQNIYQMSYHVSLAEHRAIS